MTDDASQVDNKTLLNNIERGGETGKLARAELERRLLQSAAVVVTVQGLSHEATSVSVIGSRLTAAQLCDIARAWLDADDFTHWGDFEKELDIVITKHGRFE